MGLVAGLIAGLLSGLKAGLDTGRATIAPNALTSGESNVDLNTYTTGAISPGANRLVLMWVVQSGTATEGPNDFTGTFAGTWTLVGTASAATATISLYRYMSATPASGTVNINFDVDDVTTGCSWAIVEYAGVNTTGVNGAGAVVQFVANAAAASLGQTITLAAFESASNLHAYGISHLAAEGTTPGVGFDERADVNHAGPNQSLEVADKVNDTTADPSWATSAASRWVAVELKAA